MKTVPMECEEIRHIARKISKLVVNAADDGTSLELLKELQVRKISLEILQKTRIGVVVNNLRKTSADKNVISLSKTLIKSWKKLLPAEGRSKKRSNNGPCKTPLFERNSIPTSDSVEEEDTGGEGMENLKPMPAGIRAEKGEEKAGSNGIGSSGMSNVNPGPVTEDAVRLKCRKLITDALKAGELPEGGCNPEDLARLIEDAIYKELKSTNEKYKNRVRSRVANLKDQRNPQLRLKVLRGLLSPERIATMTTEEMASDELKALRAKLTKEAIANCQRTKTGGTTTDLFKCSRCDRKNCTYTQLQTRSSDEPMTTFVLCNECGYRWKFC